MAVPLWFSCPLFKGNSSLSKKLAGKIIRRPIRMYASVSKGKDFSFIRLMMELIESPSLTETSFIEKKALSISPCNAALYTKAFSVLLKYHF